ncbi:hypothetical protein IAU60_000362 [Kwoniella sp. DSM 27419]
MTESPCATDDWSLDQEALSVDWLQLCGPSPGLDVIDELCLSPPETLRFADTRWQRQDHGEPLLWERSSPVARAGPGPRDQSRTPELYFSQSTAASVQLGTPGRHTTRNSSYASRPVWSDDPVCRHDAQQKARTPDVWHDNQVVDFHDASATTPTRPKLILPVTSPNDKNKPDGQLDTLQSPFARLGLCSPRRESATPSPTPSKPRLGSSMTRSPKCEGRRPLSSSPEWKPDTPTPSRFYTMRQDNDSKLKLETIKPPVFDLAVGQTGPSQKPVKTPPRQETKPGDGQAVFDHVTVRINWINHLSTDGGLIAAFARYRSRLKIDNKVSGANLFLNSPRRKIRSPGKGDAHTAPAWLLDGLGSEFKANSTAHAVHTTNLISPDLEMRERSKQSIIQEMLLARQLGLQTLVIHLGSDIAICTDVEDRKKTLARIWALIRDLKEILLSAPGVGLALENTVHRYPSSLASLSSISLLLAAFPHPALGLCLDLAHLHISELDLNSVAGRDRLFFLLSRVQGGIKVVHVGDSCSAHGGRGQRHAKGHIELTALRRILRHPSLRGVPTLLETPAYYRQLRLCRTHDILSKYSSRLFTLEADRAASERQYVQDLINVPEAKWDKQEANLTHSYLKEKKRIEHAIYKRVMRKGEDSWERFKRCRKREAGAARKVQGMKRCKARPVPGAVATGWPDEDNSPDRIKGERERGPVKEERGVG